MFGKFSVNSCNTVCFSDVVGIQSATTAKNTVISPNFLVWKFCGKAQFPHSFGRITFPQNFHTRKLGENTIFYTVYVRKEDSSLILFLTTFDSIYFFYSDDIWQRLHIHPDYLIKLQFYFIKNKIYKNYWAQKWLKNQNILTTRSRLKF